MMRAKAANIAISAATIGLSAWVIAVASGFPESPEPDTVGPGRLPTIVATILCLIGIVLLIRAIFAAGPDEGLPFAKAKKPAVLSLLTVAFVLALPYAGFPIAGLIWFFVTAFYLGSSWKAGLFSAALLVGFIHVVFHTLLSVPMP